MRARRPFSHRTGEIQEHGPETARPGKGREQADHHACRDYCDFHDLRELCESQLKRNPHHDCRAGGAGPIDHERAQPFALIDPENRAAFAASRVHPEVRGENRAAAASRASSAERAAQQCPSRHARLRVSGRGALRGGLGPVFARHREGQYDAERRHHRDDRERRDHRDYHLELAHGGPCSWLIACAVSTSYRFAPLMISIMRWRRGFTSSTQSLSRKTSHSSNSPRFFRKRRFPPTNYTCRSSPRAAFTSFRSAQWWLTTCRPSAVTPNWRGSSAWGRNLPRR